MLDQSGEDYVMRSMQQLRWGVGLLLVSWLYVNLSFFMPVRTVLVEGQMKDVDQDVLQSMLEEWHGMHMFWQTRPLEIALENHPWIEKASVKKRFPDQFSVYLQTRTAVLRWQNNAYLMDSHGQVMTTSTPDHLLDLPSIEAPPEARGRIFSLWQQLSASKSQWHNHLTWLRVKSFGDVEMVFRGNITVRLGNKHLAERLALFMRVADVWKVQQDKQAHTFDMRYHGSFSHQSKKV